MTRPSRAVLWVVAWTAFAASACGQTPFGAVGDTSQAVTTPLPPPPPASVPADLMHAATTSVDAYGWTNGPHPTTGFGYLHPANHTTDLRVRTENCDQAGGGSGVRGDATVCIFAATPEALTTPLAHATIAPMTKPFVIDPPTLTGVAEIDGCDGTKGAPDCVNFARGLRSICDVPTTSARNPFACDASGNESVTGDHDCYDTVHLGVLVHGQLGTFNGAPAVVDSLNRLVGTRMTVIVANPKTATAAVSNVLVRSIMNGVDFPHATNNLFTPSVSGDGRLIVVSAAAGLMYSYSAEPCNPEGWSTFLPVSEMHLDANLRTRYGLARFPLRDSENNVITATRNAEGVVTNAGLSTGGYFWMDTKANLLFFNHAPGATPYYWDGAKVQTRYAVDAITGAGMPTPAAVLACTDVDCFNTQMKLVSDLGDHDALGFFGLWTNGKVVVPDTKLNKNTLGIRAQSTLDVELYDDKTADPVAWTLMSADTRRKAAYENAFNHLPDMRPDDPRDVVWKVTTNQDTDEVAFDDFVTTRALVVSPMNTPVKSGRLDDGAPQSPNGTTAHVQNVATALSEAERATSATYIDPSFSSFQVPSAGVLHGGRVEPVAGGGVRGAGLYLDGTNYVEYTVPPQTVSMTASPGWFVSAWAAPHAFAGNQVLWSVVSGATTSRLVVHGASTLLIEAGSASASLALPSAVAFTNDHWTHVAVAATPSGTGTKVAVSINGLLLGTVTLSTASAFVPQAGGTIDLGGGAADATRFEGWVDDFRVLARVPGPEELCRQAYGTLVGITSTDAALWTYAGAFPQAGHDAITRALTTLATTTKSYGISTYPRYVCEMNAPLTVAPASSFCIANVRRKGMQPDPHRCVGMGVVFPEGPVVPHVARPDATSNSFCLSCHATGHPSPSLTPAHLAPSVAPTNTPAGELAPDGVHFASEWDARRQPMQERQWQSGVIPQGMFCANVPSATLTTGGILTDRWMANCP